MEVARRVEAGFDFEPFGAHAPTDAARWAGPGRIAGIAVSKAQAALAAVDVLDEEHRAVKGIQLEVAEVRAEHGHVQVELALLPLEPDLIAVDQFGIELESAGQRLRPANGRREREDRALQRRAIEVEPARLVAARIAHVGHKVFGRPVRQVGSAGEPVLAAGILDRNPVKLGGRVALARQPDQRPGQRAGGGIGAAQIVEDQSLNPRAGRVVVTEGRAEVLLVGRPADPEGEVELARKVDDVVREQREVLVVLVVGVDRRTDVGHRIEHAERRQDIRARCDPRSPGDCCGTNARRNAQRVGWRVESGQAAARDNPAGGKAAILATELEVVLHRQLFIGEEAADQPVKLAVEGLPVEPDFLRKGLELPVDIGIWRAVENIDRAVVGVRTLPRAVRTVPGDRGHLDVAEIVIDLTREAVILGHALVAATRRDVDRPVVVRVEPGQRLAQIAQHIDDVVAVGLQR